MNTDRFKGCESNGFPAVNNYDYVDNIPTRGIDNRSFRWEEVSVKSVYQTNEATSNGSFETNTFTGTSNLSYITTTGQETGKFPGWILTGNSTIYVGTNGITGNFSAHPLAGDVSIALYCSGASNPPIIRSTLIATGQEGPFVIGSKHQLYLLSKLNSGSEASLKAFVRGWSVGSIVSYYDYVNNTWISTEPTGRYKVDNKINTLKYEFECSSFPSATPDHFDIYISNVSTGTVVTIDDVHVDAYFKKNAFIDYITPTGYVIQMTPDLGWHDMLSMFNSSDSLGNPHLKTLGPFTIDRGNLSDNLDNSVTASIDESDFYNSTTSTFNKYLWRALAVSTNGVIQAGGFPQKFTFLGNSINNSFSVDNISEDALSTIKIVSGKKSSTMSILVDGKENYSNLEYPNATTWKATFYLTDAKLKVTFQGKEPGGATTYIRTIELNNALFSQNELALWNVFDEHGLANDIIRLPNESNYQYAQRIKDVHLNKGGPGFAGIVNGALRELSLTKIPDGISISISKNQYNQPVVSEASVEVTAYSLRITCPTFVITEKKLIDPVYNTVDLTYLPTDIPVFSSINNVKIDFNKKKVDIDSIDPSKYRIKIEGEYHKNDIVELKYNYYVEYLFKDYSDLYSIFKAISNLKDPSGIKIVDIQISGKLAGNESCLGLFITSSTIQGKNKISVPWSPVYLKKISDKGYKNYFITENITLKQSNFYEYVKELKNNTKVFWGAVEADRDRWDAADSKSLSMDSIPTLFDPPLTKIIGVGITGSIDPTDAWSKNYTTREGNLLVNQGLSNYYFQPGIGHGDHLEPDIYITNTYIEANTSLSDSVGPLKNNNNYVLFSGQK